MTVRLPLSKDRVEKMELNCWDMAAVLGGVAGQTGGSSDTVPANQPIPQQHPLPSLNNLNAPLPQQQALDGSGGGAASSVFGQATNPYAGGGPDPCL